jgi:hypothetical protein
VTAVEAGGGEGFPSICEGRGTKDEGRSTLSEGRTTNDEGRLTSGGAGGTSGGFGCGVSTIARAGDGSYDRMRTYAITATTTARLMKNVGRKLTRRRMNSRNYSDHMLLALLLAAAEEMSTIAVPIRATLAPLLPQIEAQVPKTFTKTVREKHYTVRYDVARDPVRLQMAGTGLRATTTAHYWLEACPSRLPCIGCGTDEPRRQAIIALHTQLAWDASWRLRSVTTAEPPQFLNRCRMTLLNIDITDHFIGPVVDAQLANVARAIDRHTPSLTNMRPLAQQVWSALQSPFEIAPRTWLLFEPRHAALGSLRGEGLQVTSTLAVTARTQVIVGDRPTTRTAIPLPSLRSADVAGGLHLPFDIRIPYEEASRLATQEYGHRLHKSGGTDVWIGAIRIRPAASGRIAVEADIDYRNGRYKGPVVLEGTPRIDSRRVIVPDLEYTLEPTGRTFFGRIAERFAHNTVRSRLRDSARWSLLPHATKIQEEMNRALVRQLAPGVFMRGAINLIEPRDVTARPDGIVVSVTIIGAAEISVTGLR